MDTLTVLSWAIGIVVALNIAMLGLFINMSFQLGRLSGQLNVLANHVTLH